MMPISDPRDRFFYPHHTPMKDTYISSDEITVSLNSLRNKIMAPNKQEYLSSKTNMFVCLVP